MPGITTTMFKLKNPFRLPTPDDVKQQIVDVNKKQLDAERRNMLAFEHAARQAQMQADACELRISRLEILLEYALPVRPAC